MQDGTPTAAEDRQLWAPLQKEKYMPTTLNCTLTLLKREVKEMF